MTNSIVLVDVVNFNADASCLSSRNWLDFIDGGDSSLFYRWLSLYVKHNKKVVIGFPGATASDLIKFNPESIDLINSNPHIFELILRPYSHDISVLRSEEGFKLNLEAGIEIIKSTFDKLSPFYLPPEFMCSSTQLTALEGFGIKGLFINPGRLNDGIGRRIPQVPYKIRGLLGTSTCCIPFYASSTSAYLESIHKFDSSPWNTCLKGSNGSPVYSWRDGESAFLLPSTVEREDAWLRQECDDIKREHLTDLHLKPIDYQPFQSGGNLFTYPIHSFSAWVREMKMYWFIRKVQKTEEKLSTMNTTEKSLWLQIIGSDILSAVEKISPAIEIIYSPSSTDYVNYTIYRKEKEFEGEEFFCLLENLNSAASIKYLKESKEPHIVKLRKRIEHLTSCQSLSQLHHQ